MQLNYDMEVTLLVESPKGEQELGEYNTLEEAEEALMNFLDQDKANGESHVYFIEAALRYDTITSADIKPKKAKDYTLNWVS